MTRGEFYTVKLGDLLSSINLLLSNVTHVSYLYLVVGIDRDGGEIEYSCILNDARGRASYDAFHLVKEGTTSAILENLRQVENRMLGIGVPGVRGQEALGITLQDEKEELLLFTGDSR